MNIIIFIVRKFKKKHTKIDADLDFEVFDKLLVYPLINN